MYVSELELSYFIKNYETFAKYFLKILILELNGLIIQQTFNNIFGTELPDNAKLYTPTILYKYNRNLSKKKSPTMVYYVYILRKVIYYLFYVISIFQVGTMVTFKRLSVMVNDINK